MIFTTHLLVFGKIIEKIKQININEKVCQGGVF